MTRAAEIADFLAAEGWGDAVRAPLAGDASARRYERLRRAGAPAILMDVPPDSGLVVGPFLAVDAWLRAAGFSAPAVLAADEARGLVLLEDLGDDLFARLCAAAPGREAGLYAAAVDLLADLQRLPPPAGAWTPPPYDLAFLLREARLALEWYLPAATGAAAPADLAAEYEALAAAAFAPFATPAVAVYRDFHAENLIWLPERGRPRPRRPARLPGHAGRAPGLRPRVAARGRPPRRRAGAARGDARPLPRRAAAPRPKRWTRRRTCSRRSAT